MLFQVRPPTDYLFVTIEGQVKNVLNLLPFHENVLVLQIDDLIQR